MSSPLVSETQRQFATEVVRKLRGEGFVAYWAGGCVRDQLSGRKPKDYDVATDATPPQIRELFGHRRTLAIGVAFGVVTILGPPGAGPIEVATFRQDAEYSDGRHPDAVTFSSPEADAARRDFTINGLFYDPIEDRVIDFVGGQEDLRRRVIRAIGDPRERFREDKLRMLRAVRFAATFEFALDPATREAIGQMAPEITVVSAERIAAEMQRILVDRHRSRGVRLLIETGLAAAFLPEILPHDAMHERRLEETLAVLDRLEGPSFPLALAALLVRWVDAEGTLAIGRRWRLSNHQTERAAWLVEHRAALRGARRMRWSSLQKLLIAEGIHDLLALEEAEARAGFADLEEVAWCHQQLEMPPEALDPAPLVTGDDLIRHGIKPGPKYRLLLDRIRDAQLDGEIHNMEDALELADRLMKEEGERRKDEG